MCFLARCLQRLLRGTLLVSLAAGVLAPATAQTAAATDRPLLMQEVGSHSAPVRRIDVDVARGIAVTASDDRTARIWGLANGELRQVLRPFAFGAQAGRLYGVALHPKENLVAVAGTTGGEGQPHFIYLFDTESGQLQATIDARAGDVRKLAWSPDGTVLAAGYNGTNGVRFFARDGRELLDDRTDGPVFGLAIGANGLAAAVGLDGSLRAYRLSGGAVTRIAAITTAVRRPAGVAFSPDGRQIVVAYATANEGPELFDAATLASQGRLPVPRMFGGDFRVLAWSADGRRIAIGGTAYSRDLKFPVVTIDVASRAVAETADVAGDSVTDLLALPAAAGGGFAFASFDGSWGTVGTGAAVRTVGKPVFAVRGNAPQDLQISDDARSVQWGTVNPGGGFGFAFERRRLVTAPRESLRAPETRFGLFNAPTDWLQDARPPVIGGKAMQLAADERGRALVITRGQPNAAIVGTNRALPRQRARRRRLARRRRHRDPCRQRQRRRPHRRQRDGRRHAALVARQRRRAAAHAANAERRPLGAVHAQRLLRCQRRRRPHRRLGGAARRGPADGLLLTEPLPRAVQPARRHRPHPEDARRAPGLRRTGGRAGGRAGGAAARVRARRRRRPRGPGPGRAAGRAAC
jgi:dipeptidyl aminopeptidase/acylaminoacyl peptidase